MIQNIHHINFLVHDLDLAVMRYSTLLNGATPIREDLPQRGVSSARFKVGNTWLVLLQPYEAGSIPGRHLAEHGEGFFMISFAADDFEQTIKNLETAGIAMQDEADRAGLDGWRIRDVDAREFFGVKVQLTRDQES